MVVANCMGVPGETPSGRSAKGTIFSTGQRQPAREVMAMDADMICRNRRRLMPLTGASIPPGNSFSSWARNSSVSPSSCRLRQ